jgi:5'-phosphate synthase pdxT subunit
VLAKKATGKNAPATLGLIDITVDRNAYGTQRESFEASIKVTGLKGLLSVAFIRAPKITRVGKHTEVLAMHDAHPVLVREDNVMVATFHPEVRGEVALHRLFLARNAA